MQTRPAAYAVIVRDGHVLLSHGSDGSGPLRFVRMINRARVTGGAERAEVDGTTDGVEWFALDEVPGLQRVGLIDIARATLG